MNLSLKVVTVSCFIQAVECLLKSGATADVPGGPDLETPLHEAVANNHLDCVRSLLTFSANPNFANATGFSPLQACVALLEKSKTAMTSTVGRKTSTVKLKKTLTTLASIKKLLCDASSASSHNVDMSVACGDALNEISFADNLVANLSACALFLERSVDFFFHSMFCYFTALL